MSNTIKKQKAVALRLKGKSYLEISRELQIAKSTLASWLRGIQLSDEKKIAIESRSKERSLQALLARNHKQTANATKLAKSIRTEAEKEVNELIESPLFVLGVSLYWAEGYKRPIIRNGQEKTYHSVSLTNSDYRIIAVFIAFLNEICAVSNERMKIGLRCFPHQNPETLREFWSKSTGITLSQITTSIVNSSSQNPIRPYNQLPNGVAQVRVADTKLYHRIMGWIDGLSQIR